MKLLNTIVLFVTLYMCSLRAQDGMNPYGLINTGDGEMGLGDFDYCRIGKLNTLYPHILGALNSGELSAVTSLLNYSLSTDSLSRIEEAIANSTPGVVVPECFDALVFNPLQDMFTADALREDIENVIIMVHGWNPKGNTNQYGGEFVMLTVNLINALHGTGWGLSQYDWAENAATGGVLSNFTGSGGVFNSAVEAASIADSHGRYLAEELLSKPNLSKVTLMCHSAGSWVGYRAAKILLSQNDSVEVEVIFMDPFVPGRIIGMNSPLTAERISSLNSFGDRIMLHNYHSDNGFDAVMNCLGEDISGGIASVMAYGTDTEFNWGLQHEQVRVDSAYLLLLTAGDCAYGGHEGPIKFVSDTVSRWLGNSIEGWNGSWDGEYGFQDSLFTKWLEEEPLESVEMPPGSINISDYIFDDLYPNGLQSVALDLGILSNIGGSLESLVIPNETPDPLTASIIFDCDNVRGLFGTVSFSPVSGADEYRLYRDGEMRGSVTAYKPISEHGVSANDYHVYRVEAHNESGLLDSVEFESSVPSDMCPAIHEYTPTGLSVQVVGGTQVWLSFDPIVDAPNGMMYELTRKGEGREDYSILFGVESGFFADMSIAPENAGDYSYTLHATYSHDRLQQSPKSEVVYVTTMDPSLGDAAYDELVIPDGLEGPHFFSGDRFGYAVSTSSLNLPDIFTIEGRVRFQNDTVESHTIMDTGVLRLGIGVGGDLVLVYSSDSAKTEYRILGFLSEETEDVWQTFTFVVDVANKHMTTYVDGVLVPGEYTWYSAVSIGHTTEPLRIGGVPFSVENFKGGIDYLRVWNRVLSQEDVGLNYELAYFDFADGLIASWNFDSSLDDQVGSYNLVGLGGVGLVSLLEEDLPTFTPPVYENGEDTLSITDNPYSGEVMYLSGNRDGYAESTSPLNLPNIFTIEGRVKLLDDSLSQTLVDFGGGGRLEIGGGGDLVFVYVDGPEKTESRVRGFLDSDTHNTWITFAFVVDVVNKEMLTYVNGVWVENHRTWDGATSIGNATNPLRIGGVPSSTENFNGDIDYIRIWSEQLSSDQIALNHGVVYLEAVDGMITNWNFDGSLEDSVGTHDLVGYGGVMLNPSPYVEDVSSEVETVGDDTEDTVVDTITKYAMFYGGGMRLTGTEGVDLGGQYTWQMRLRPGVEGITSRVFSNGTKSDGSLRGVGLLVEVKSVLLGSVLEDGVAWSSVVQQLSQSYRNESRIFDYLPSDYFGHSTPPWITITIVFNNSVNAITWYVDDVLVSGELFSDGQYIPSPDEMSVGVQMANGAIASTEAFFGDIDYFRIFGYALTAEQVVETQNLLSSEDLSDMVGNWNFNGNGNDDSGNGFDAEIVGGVGYYEE